MEPRAGICWLDLCKDAMGEVAATLSTAKILQGEELLYVSDWEQWK